MKILFVTEQVIMGGGETNLIDVINELDFLGYDVTVAAPPNAKLFDYLPNIKKIKDSDLANKRWKKCFFSLYKTKNNQYLNFDIIHFYSVNPIPMFRSVSARVKIWTAHGHWECNNLIKSIMLKKMINKVVFVSKDVQIRVPFFYSMSRVVNLGVGRGKINLLKLNKFNSNNADFDVLKVLCLGRFQKIKRQDLLVDAIDKLPMNVECKLVGGVDETNEDDVAFMQNVLQQLARLNRRKGRKIEVLPHSNNIEQLYSWADICVVPSDYESFSMVTIESLLSETPVVVTNSGAPSEFIKESIAGIDFDAGSYDSLACKIEEMYQRFPLIKSSDFSSFKTKYTIDNQVSNLINEYKGL
ncbi:Glycosyl transferase family 1 domain-containing protein [Vibrio crassostreae]|nr:Glycosyl transferase family 1 domain-containing protein [Vibrio crassostreae]